MARARDAALIELAYRIGSLSRRGKLASLADDDREGIEEVLATLRACIEDFDARVVARQEFDECEFSPEGLGAWHDGTNYD
jgi:hypothetical protein